MFLLREYHPIKDIGWFHTSFFQWKTRTHCLSYGSFASAPLFFQSIWSLRVIRWMDRQRLLYNCSMHNSDLWKSINHKILSFPDFASYVIIWENHVVILSFESDTLASFVFEPCIFVMTVFVSESFVCYPRRVCSIKANQRCTREGLVTSFSSSQIFHQKKSIGLQFDVVLSMHRMYLDTSILRLGHLFKSPFIKIVFEKQTLRVTSHIILTFFDNCSVSYRSKQIGKHFHRFNSNVDFC